MTKADFYKSENFFSGFKISGHAMVSIDEPDVLCAAISGMTNLVINTLTEVFGAKLKVFADEKEPCVEVILKASPEESKFSCDGIIKGFLLQLEDLQNQYPDNLCVTVQQNTTKGTKRS